MLNFVDMPYQYYPPKANRFLITCLRWLNKNYHLPGDQHLINSVLIENKSTFFKLLKNYPNARILFTPNHSTHSDPQIMFEVQRQLKVYSKFMAAYDGFHQGWFKRWVMQHCGAFSVDREGSDKHAMKEAINTLIDGKYSMTIFPEGNVSLMNDLVFPFLEGAAFIALKAQNTLGADTPVIIIPISIKATFAENPASLLKERIQEISSVAEAEEIDKEDESLFLIKAGIMVLETNLKQRGYKFSDVRGAEKLPNILEEAALILIRKLEEKMELKATPETSLFDRIRKIRCVIHQIRIDEKQSSKHFVAATWADEAILALRILSYRGDYLVDRPSFDRLIEVSEKLLEDIYSKVQKPKVSRDVIVRLNEPIFIKEYLTNQMKGNRVKVDHITRQLESRVQEGLNKIQSNLKSFGDKVLKKDSLKVE